MGGHGSGRYAAGYEVGKDVVEIYICLDINDFTKYLRDHKKKELEGKIGDNPFSVFIDPAKMAFYTDYKDEHINITLDKTSCNYGGYRYWFLCPGCDKRVGKLYHGVVGFACRSCYDLNYISQQYAKTDCSYYIRKMYQVADKIDPDFDRQGLNTYCPIFKPKHMHQKTFDRLRYKFELYKFKGERVWANGAARAMGWK